MTRVGRQKLLKNVKKYFFVPPPRSTLGRVERHKLPKIFVTALIETNIRFFVPICIFDYKSFFYKKMNFFKFFHKLNIERNFPSPLFKMYNIHKKLDSFCKLSTLLGKKYLKKKIYGATILRVLQISTLQCKRHAKCNIQQSLVFKNFMFSRKYFFCGTVQKITNTYSHYF